VLGRWVDVVEDIVREEVGGGPGEPVEIQDIIHKLM